jgi:hypothetical protein
MSKPDFNPFDPVSAAMGALHQNNLLEAEKAKQKAMLYAGNELARVLDDVAQIQQLDAIAKAVVIATIAKWNRAKTGQL